MRIVEITGLTDRALDVYARLTEPQLRSRVEPEKGIFIAESPKVIAAALAAGCQPVSVLTERKHLPGLAALFAGWEALPVYTGQRELLASLTGYALTRGVLCAMRRPAPRTWERVLDGARRIGALEGIVDATNVGALFRSAAALGMDGLLVSSACCDPLNRRSVRVSMGAVFQIPWAAMPPGAAVGALQSRGFRVAAMALRDDAVPLNRLEPGEKLAVVLGSEGYGLPEETIRACDVVTRIPMAHGVDSLNVAAAGAVAFWHLAAPSDGK